MNRLIYLSRKNFCKISLYEKFRGFYNEALENYQKEGITIVRTEKHAQEVIKILENHKKRIIAWDTETIDLEVKKESPIGNGHIICATAYGGPDLDFGNGLFIDNFGRNADLILVFKEYFEDNNLFKCWHNYGFDRHILFNHGINCFGFGGDTMHMSRLLDPSRGPKEYSLSALTRGYQKEIIKIREKIIKATLSSGNYDNNNPIFSNQLIKTNMSQLFGRYKKLKNGEVGKMIEIPEVIELHTSSEYIEEWVNYASLDAESTFYLKEYLSASLYNLKINIDGMDNLLDLYNKYWLPFGELLTEMERTGIKINLQHLQECQIKAENELKELEINFLKWLQSIQEDDVSQFNMSSVQQLQHLIYAPFKRHNSEVEEEDIVIEDDEIDPETGRKRPKKTIKNTYPEMKTFSVLNLKGEILEGKTKAMKNTDMTIKGYGIPATEFTASGLPSVETDALKKLAGEPEKGIYGRAHEIFKARGKEQEGIEFSKAMSILIEKRAIETLIQTFIVPLQNCIDPNHRIHCSLNLNTETGRLSARRPNLQNQPALEKDKYKIRKAFTADEGKKLIIADYGQLELRILAHMTNCKNMIEAFESGGDFHSRTALGMYDEIKNALEIGDILLEWDKSQGKPPVPLLKDKYASERRKAKTMNFSIAYGKSAYGFSKDWNCSMEEAKQELEKWYSSRQEVLEWQENIKKIALEKGWSQTLLGRFRNLTRYFTQKGKSGRSQVMHGLRAAINTPIQGGAADIVIASMVKIYKNERIKELGWKILLQIHDELILEGPEESVDEAFEIVKKEMEDPLDIKLRVKMEVDAKICDNWFDGK